MVAADDAIAERIKEVESFVLELDESIRGPAFTMMRDYIIAGDRVGSENKSKVESHALNESPVTSTNFTSFMDQFETDKPAENAKAIAAHFYSKYGIQAFVIGEIEEMASDAGVIVPTRIDKTFLEAKIEGKPLFKRIAPGKFRPTIHAEAYFKRVFGVRKGTAKHPAD